MTEKDIERLRAFLERKRMMDSFDALVINLQNDKNVYYTTPEFSEKTDCAQTFIHNQLAKSKLNAKEIETLWQMIEDYAYYKSRIYYEYGFKAGTDFFKD